MKKNIQLVVLITYEGMAYDNVALERIWEDRLKQFAPHYHILSAKVILKGD